MAHNTRRSGLVAGQGSAGQTYPYATGSQIVGTGLPAGPGSRIVSQPANVVVTPGLPPAAATYAATITADSPARYWRLGDAGPTMAAVVGVNLGPNSGPATFGVPGLITDSDTACSFNGSNQDAFGSDTGCQTGNGPWSTEAWVKTTATSYQIVIGWGRQGVADGDAFMTMHPSGFLHFANSTTSNPFGSTVINNGVRHHIVLTWDGTNMRGYVDGAQVGSAWAYGTFALATGFQGVNLALRSGNWWNGTLDEPAIYNFALSPAQIANHYAAGIGGLRLSTFAPTATVGTVVNPPPVGSAGYSAVVVADSPAGYWRLGEASGLPQDSSGNARHATAIGGTPTYGVPGALAGDANSAMSFDGTTNYVSVPDVGLDFGDVLTIELWAIPTADFGTAVGKGNNAYGLQIDNTTRKIIFVSSNNVDIVLSTVAIPATGWHHLVATKNGANVHLYIDAVDVTGTVTNVTLIDNTFALTIGANHGGDQDRLAASLDEVAVYAYALTAAQVTAHYNAGAVGLRLTTLAPTVTVGTVVIPGPAGVSYAAAVLADSPRGYWQLGEASGLPQDASGNGRHMTVSAGTVTYGVPGAVTGTTAITFSKPTSAMFSTPDVAGLDLGDVFTVEAWISRGSSAFNRAIASKGTGGYYLRLNPTNFLQLLVSQVAVIVTSTIAVPTGWHHVAATKSGATVKLYIDGVDVTGTVTNTTAVNNSIALTIGEDETGSGEHSDSTLGHIAVYPTALSAASILAHYTAPNGLVLTFYAPTATVAAAGITVTPSTAALVDTQFAPTMAVTNNQLVTPTTAALTTTLLAPSARQALTVTPSLLTLITTPLAPTVSVSNNQLFTPTTTALVTTPLAPTTRLDLIRTPSTVALVTTPQAPTAAVSNHQLFVPSTAALVTAPLAPTAAVSNNITVTPSPTTVGPVGLAPSAILGTVLVPAPLALVSTSLAPTVTASNHQLFVPSTTALVITIQTPSAVKGTVLVPSVTALVTTPLAPTVTASNHQLVTPSTTALVITPLAPSALAPRLSIPPVTPLVLSPLAPTLVQTFNQFPTPATTPLVLTGLAPAAVMGTVLVPAKASLVLTSLLPTVFASDFKLATPSLTALVLTPLAPVVFASDFKLFTPPTASLATTNYVAILTISNNQAFVPSTSALVTAGLAPSIGQGIVPTNAALQLNGLAPSIVLSNHQLVVPSTLAINLTTFAPSTTGSDFRIVTPGTAALVSTALAPSIVQTFNWYIVPAVGSLTLTPLAPTVATTAHQFPTPSLAALVTNPLAPAANLSVNRFPTPALTTLVTSLKLTTLAFACGSERPGDPAHWDTVAANAGSVTQDSTHAHTGTNALKVVNDGYVVNFPPAGTRRLVLRLWVWLPSTPSVIVRLVEIQGAQQRLLFWNPATGKLGWFDGTASLAVFPLDQWNSVDLTLDSSTNSHTAAWRINEVTQPTPASASVAASDLTSYFLGSGNASAGNRWYDDIAASYTAADYPIPDGAAIWNGSAETWVVTPPTVFASDTQLAVPSTTALVTATFAPTIVNPAGVTPSTTPLAVTALAPTVTASNLQAITPSTTALVLTGLAPTIINPQGVIPSTTALVITTFAPVVFASDFRLATPIPAAIVSSAKVPLVTASDFKLATPTTTALTLAGLAPVVTASDFKLATPSTASLVTARFAPTVLVEAHPVLAIPSTSALVLTTLAPTVAVTAASSIVIPSRALTLTTLPAVVSFTAHQTLVAGKASLTLTALAPVVFASNRQIATPLPAGLSLVTFAPTPVLPQLDVPDPVALVLTRLAPTVQATAHKVATPTTRALVITPRAPSTTAADYQLVTPDPTELILVVYSPSVAISDRQRAVPAPAALSLAGTPPDVAATAHQVIVPGTVPLILTPRSAILVATDHKVLLPLSALLQLTGYEVAPLVNPVPVFDMADVTSSDGLETHVLGSDVSVVMSSGDSLGTVVTASDRPLVEVS